MLHLQRVLSIFCNHIETPLIAAPESDDINSKIFTYRIACYNFQRYVAVSFFLSVQFAAMCSMLRLAFNGFSFSPVAWLIALPRQNGKRLSNNNKNRQLLTKFRSEKLLTNARNYWPRLTIRLIPVESESKKGYMHAGNKFVTQKEVLFLSKNVYT